LHAETGPAALDLMAASPNIDLLLTDVFLPQGMSGPDVAGAFNERYPAAGVLFSSGYTGNALRRRGHLDEDAMLIRKPYQCAELAKHVRQVLDGGE